MWIKWLMDIWRRWFRIKPVPKPGNPTAACVECGTEVIGVSAVIAVANDEGGQTYSVYIFECPIDIGYYWYTKTDDIEP